MNTQKFYKSDVNCAEFSFDEYAPHGREINYKGFNDLPKELYPFSIVEKQVPFTGFTARWKIDFLTAKGFTEKEIEIVLNGRISSVG